MAEKKPTKDVVPVKASDAELAAWWRNQGQDIQFILERTSYNTPMEVLRAIREHNDEMMLNRQEDRQRNKYDRQESLMMLLAKCWDIIEEPPGKYNKDGDWLEPDTGQVIAAIRAATDIQKSLMQLQGLMKEDIREVSNQVVIIGGDQASYIEKLKELAD